METHYKVVKTAPHWTEDQDAVIRKLINEYRQLEQQSRRGEKLRKREEFAEEVLSQYPLLQSHKVKDIAGHFKFISEILNGELSVERVPIKYKKWIGIEKSN